jgi:sugar/nucleoside kinase (ribokinase family)
VTDRFDIVGLGLATVDVMAIVPHLPELDEVYPTQRTLLQGGGPVATALVTASRLGCSTTYLGAIGSKGWGDVIRKEFAAYDVDIAYAPRRGEGESPISIILVDASSGARSILYDPGSVDELAPPEIPVEVIQSAHALHLDGVHPRAAFRAAEIAREAGVRVSLDGGAGKAWPEMERLLPLVDLLVVAQQFAEHVTGESDPLVAGPILLETYDPDQAVITAGDSGSWYWDRERHFHQPAYSVPVVDTTGAGDVYHGAYLYAVLQDWSPQQCLRFASAAAALKCRAMGGRTGIPTRDEVSRFLKQHHHGEE